MAILIHLVQLSKGCREVSFQNDLYKSLMWSTGLPIKQLTYKHASKKVRKILCTSWVVVPPSSFDIAENDVRYTSRFEFDTGTIQYP